MKKLLAVMACLGVTACATDPVVDHAYSRNPQNYNRDLADCNRIAEEQTTPVGTTVTRTAIGAAVGAVVGVATGAIVGAAGTGAAIGAVTGAGAGAVSGGLDTHSDRRTIVANCLRNRGHAVLR
jgi:outer membrane lipoprotein SlyB